MTLEEVKKFIEENKDNDEVKAYLQGLNQLTLEGVLQFINENQDAKKWLDSEKDKHFSKGLETWKNNHLQKLIDEEIAKRFPAEDEKDRELREIKLKLQQMEQEKLYESLKNKALTIATEKKIPTSIIDLFIGKDEESTVSNLKRFEEVMNPYIQTIVEDRIKEGSYVPPDNKKSEPLTLEHFKGMTAEQINAKWDEYQKSLENK